MAQLLYDKERAKPVRNTIKVLDNIVPKVTFRDLDYGEMFSYRYPKSEQSIYMKINKQDAVLLTSGVVIVVSDDAPLIRVSSIQISSL